MNSSFRKNVKFLSLNFFHTTDLHNTKRKSKLNKRATEPYGSHIEETKKVRSKEKHPYIYVYLNCVYKFFLQELNS